MPLITRAQLARVAPHASARIVAAIVDHADLVLPRYGLATKARLPDFLAHVLIESAYLRRTEEDLDYSAERLVAVWPTRFRDAAAAAPYAHDPRALADKVYGGRMGNAAPDDGWLNRGQGLIQTTGHDNIARLAAHLKIDFDAARTMLTSDAGMLEAAAATYCLLGAPAFADKGDIVGSTRAVNGGLNGLADRRAALALCRKVWPDIALPTTRATPLPVPVPAVMRPPVPRPAETAAAAASPHPIPTKETATMTSGKSLTLLATILTLLGMGTAHAEAVSLTPLLNEGIGGVLVPVLLALVGGGAGAGAILVMPLRRFIGQVAADKLAAAVDRELGKAIAFAASELEAYVDRADFQANVNGWIQNIAMKYATDHAPSLMRWAGGDLAEKISARLSKHDDVLALKGAAAAANDNAGAPLQLAGAAA